MLAQSGAELPVGPSSGSQIERLTDCRKAFFLKKIKGV